jgi:hypothetical protein
MQPDYVERMMVQHLGGEHNCSGRCSLPGIEKPSSLSEQPFPFARYPVGSMHLLAGIPNFASENEGAREQALCQTHACGERLRRGISRL